MLKMFIIYTIFAIVLVCTEGTLVDFDAVPKFEQCGGTVESDIGIISYPSENSTLQPGEICVWTIHLQTTTNFRFNFTKLDVVGGQNDCSNAEVGLYSLSNLISNETSENYRFCSEVYPWRAFLLPENVAAIVLRTSAINGSNPGSGFTLTWEGTRGAGITFDHSSSYTSVTSGLIKYPFNGEYSPNLVNTWLFNGPSAESRTSVNISSVSLEPCPLSDPCWCDAIVLYQIGADGFLNEATRICRDGVNNTQINVESTFILAFYTDERMTDGAGYGFQMSYELIGPPTTTARPTTLEPTTPTTPAPITTCGGIVEIDVGSIEYKLNQVYEPNLRCVWIIKSLKTSNAGVYVVKETSDIGVASEDYISVFGFDKQGNGDMQAEFGSVDGIESVHFYASMFIVVFTTDGRFTNKGWRLRWEFHCCAQGPRTQTELLTAEHSGSLIVPPPGSTQVSLFVFSRNFQSFGDTGIMGSLNVTDVKFEDCTHPTPPTGCDQIAVYQMEGRKLNELDLFYQSGNLYGPYNATDLFIVALGTTTFSYGDGFTLNWSWD